MEIIKKIQEDGPSISAMLEDYFPHHIDQNVLYIQSKTSAVFNEKFIKRGKQLLEQYFELLFKNKIVVEIKLEEKIINKKAPSNSGLKLDNKIKDEEIFNKVVDLFDGEILR